MQVKLKRLLLTLIAGIALLGACAVSPSPASPETPSLSGSIPASLPPSLAQTQTQPAAPTPSLSSKPTPTLPPQQTRTLPPGVQAIYKAAFTGLQDIAVSPSGEIYFADGSSVIHVIRENGSPKDFLTFDRTPGGLRFAPDGFLYVSGGIAGRPGIHKVSPGKEVTYFSSMMTPRMDFSPSGELFAFGGPNAQTLFKIDRQGKSQVIYQSAKKLYDVAVSPQGQAFVSASDGSITNIGTGKILVSGLNTDDPLNLEFGKDGNLYFTDRKYGFARVDLNSGDIIRNDNWPSNGKDFVFDSLNRPIFTLFEKGIIFRWDLQTGISEMLAAGGINGPGLITGENDRLYLGWSVAYPWREGELWEFSENGNYKSVLGGLGEIMDVVQGESNNIYILHRQQNQPSKITLTDGRGSSKLVKDFKNTPLMPGSSICYDKTARKLVSFNSQKGQLFRVNLDGSIESFGKVSLEPCQDARLTWTSGYTYILQRFSNYVDPAFYKVYRFDEDGNAVQVAGRTDKFSNVLVDITATAEGKVYAVFSPSCEIYEVGADGTWRVALSGLDMDTAGIATDSKGNIYFVNSAGLFRWENFTR